ncbi:MAG: hypothetical protein LUD72_01930 [Bacteroidales bacterium]|nr:hypothetical protein [Bacteroidales bacterium]
MGYSSKLDHSWAVFMENLKFRGEVYISDAEVETYTASDFADGNIPEAVRNLCGEYISVQWDEGWVETGRGCFVDTDWEPDGPAIILVKKRGYKSIQTDSLVRVFIARKAAEPFFAETDPNRCSPEDDYDFYFDMQSRRDAKKIFGENWKQSTKIFLFTVNSSFDIANVPKEIRTLKEQNVVVYAKDGRVMAGRGTYEKNALSIVRRDSETGEYEIVHVKDSEMVFAIVEEDAPYAKAAKNEKRLDRFPANFHPAKAVVQQFKEMSKEEGGSPVSFCQYDIEKKGIPENIKNLNNENVLVFTKEGKLLRGRGYWQERGVSGLCPSVLVQFCRDETCLPVRQSSHGMLDYTIVPVSDISLIYIEEDSKHITEYKRRWNEFERQMDDFIKKWESEMMDEDYVVDGDETKRDFSELSN